MKRRRQTLILCSILAILGLPIAAAPASAFSCGSLYQYRGYDVASGVSNATGVYSRIVIPPSGSITGIAQGRASAADIFLINGSDFVQAGWYVGNTDTGLPYTTTPHFWYGEYYPGQPGSELLHQGAALTWGQPFLTRIVPTSTAGQYQVYLNSTLAWTTTRTHSTTAQAGFNGEVNLACVRMEAKATNAPSPILQYLTSGSWHYFVDQRGVQQPSGSSIFFSVSGGTSASDYSYGGGS